LRARGAVIWLFVETVRPLTWGVRWGNRWLVVGEVQVRIPMATMRGQASPAGYVRGFGTVRLEANGRRAILEPHPNTRVPSDGTEWSLTP
jgi:hypothetical protein